MKQKSKIKKKEEKTRENEGNLPWKKHFIRICSWEVKSTENYLV